jgi:hypothetical protein
MTFFIWHLHTAKYIKNQLNKAIDKRETRPDLWYYVLGIWDSRIFGLCIYRRKGSPLPNKEQEQERSVASNAK